MRKQLRTQAEENKRVLSFLLVEARVLFLLKKLYDLQKQSSTFENKEKFYQRATKRTNQRGRKTEEKENRNENKKTGKELSGWLPPSIIIVVIKTCSYLD